MNFSKIEKDLKSYGIIISYLKMFQDSCTKDDILRYDNRLQHDEIELHNCINGYSPCDQIQSIVWVNKYAKPYRNYLNALKWIASLIQVELDMRIAMEVNQSYVFDVIEKYDERIQAFLECVF